MYRAFSTVMPVPDAMVFVDVDPETAMERVSSRGSAVEMFENRESMEEIRRRVLSEPGVVVVDGSGTPEEVARDILEKVAESCSNLF